MRNRSLIAASLAAGAAAAAAAVVLVAPVLAIGSVPVAEAACSPSTNCTNATLNVGNTIGTTGFPTSVTLTGQAGQTASATATPYSIFSNAPWTLTFQTDPADVFTVSGPALWVIGAPPAPSFQISGTTSLAHSGVTYNLLDAQGSPVPAPIQIDSGGPTAGGQNFADTFSVAIPATAPPGAYVSEYDYVLAG